MSPVVGVPRGRIGWPAGTVKIRLTRARELMRVGGQAVGFEGFSREFDNQRILRQHLQHGACGRSKYSGSGLWCGEIGQA